MRKIEAEAQAVAHRLQAQAEAEASRIKGMIELESFQQSERRRPRRSLRRELDALKDLAKTANARIYIGFDKHGAPRANGD